MEPLFATSYAKVARAKTFISELSAEQERFASTGVTASVIIENGNPILNVVWAGTGHLPGIILGDAVHNLRSALDLMATELADIAHVDPEAAYFPFATNLEHLRVTKKFKDFARCGSDCAQLLETIAPYRGGNESLRALHDLDIQDKHRSLIPSLKDIEFSMEGEFDLDDPNNHSLVAKADVVQYKFPDGSPLAAQPIIPSLRALAQTVEGVLESFAALIAARRKAPNSVGD